MIIAGVTCGCGVIEEQQEFEHRPAEEASHIPLVTFSHS